MLYCTWKITGLLDSTFLKRTHGQSHFDVRRVCWKSSTLWQKVMELAWSLNPKRRSIVWIHHETQTEIWSSSAINLSIGFNPFQCASAGLRDDVGMLRLVFHQGDKHQSCWPFFCSFQCIDSLGIWTWRRVPGAKPYHRCAFEILYNA